MLRIGVAPMPPARSTAGRVISLCSVNDPLGRLTVNFVPRAAAFKAHLKAVLRMRVAIMTGLLSQGEVASEKVRELSHALPMHARVKAKSACCPARNSKLAPLVSNQKAIVSLAILCLSTSVISYSAMDFSFGRSLLGSYSLSCASARQTTIPKALFRPSPPQRKASVFKPPRFHFRNKCGTYQRP